MGYYHFRATNVQQKYQKMGKIEKPPKTFGGFNMLVILLLLA